MKFKREIIIISLIIAMLFSVSAVNAVDSEIQAISAHNSTDTIVSIVNDDNLKMNDANEILAETDNGSFAALNTKISGATAGSTVYLENDYEYSSSDTIDSGIFIDKNLIIDGQGHKIDAKQKSRIFDCSPYAVVDVTLKNIIFLNGKADYGGALYWYPDGGESNIINCTFIGNSASGSYGGGATINEQDGISNIINCTFIDNHDTNCALYLSSTNVINSVFLNNGETTIYGQNIEADYNWFGNTIDNYDTAPSVRTSSALNNWYVLNMTTNGANNVATLTLNNLYDRSEIKPCDTYALPSVTFDVEGTNATLNKDAVTLDSNGKASFGFTVTEYTGKLTASTDGVSLSKDVVNMADDGTMATLNTKIIDAISNGESEVKLYNDYVYSDSELVKNTINNGNSNNGIGIATDFTIDGQGYTIDGNNRGGRIFYIFAQSKLVTLKNINFVNCTDGYAGVFYAAYCDLRVINCTFTNSTVTANPGGVAYVSYPVTVEIINSTFIKNKAPSGGAIFVFGAQTTNVLVNNSIFINNIATNNVGSAVYCNKYGSYTINNCILLNNTGYAVYNNNAQSTLKVDYNWWGNTVENSDEWEVVSSYDENAYDNWVYLDVAIDDINSLATIKLNNLYTYGVGPSAYDYDLPKITLNVQTTNASINTNTVTLDENGQTTINYEMTENEGTLKVSYINVEITKNIKLFVQDSFTSLKRQIDECEESTFYLHQNYTYDSDFDENLTNGIEITKSITVDGNGYTIDGKGLKNIFYFEDNTNTKDLILKNIIFVNATTTTNGAAVYFKGNKIEITNCTFINNNANSEGDAIYIANAISDDNKIFKSTFINNTGANSVVNINLDSIAKLHLNNSIFLKNSASKNVKGTSNVIVEYNWFGNTAENYANPISKVDGVTENNWLFLKIDAESNIEGTATISLNNVYEDSKNSTYDEYSLPTITLTLGGSGIKNAVNTVTIGDNGQANYGFTMLKTTSSLVASYEDITATKGLEYIIVDDGSFKALNDILWFTEGDIVLNKNYTFIEGVDTITNGISIIRGITVNGNGSTIDAKGKAAILIVRAHNVQLKNINFINGISNTGAAIATSADYLNIDNCTFINNTASGDGGAIYSGSFYSGSITNSKFINNSANEDGGAIITFSYYSPIDIEGCTFINNTALYSSAIYANKCHIQDSIFLNNPGNMVYERYSPSARIESNWFGNTIDNYNTKPSTNTLINWLYLDIKFLDDVAIVSLNNLCTSSGSTSVYTNLNLPEITLNINSTTLNLNTDKVTLDSTGKAIVPYTKIVDDAKLTVSNDYISLTKDCVVGEFNVLQDLIDTTVGDTIVLNRNYTFIDGVDTLTNGISITRDITIEGNGSTIDGSNLARIFYITTNGVTLKNINFINGSASQGGAIYNSEGSGFKLINCTFENNEANNDHGGAIYTYSKGVNDFINCTFIGNKITASSQKHGGAIYVDEVSGQNNFIGCTFINNTATRNGGAIALYNGKAVTKIDKSVFITNTAVFYHSIYCDGGDSAEFYLNNSIIFSKDSSTQVYVASSVGAGDVNNNWWMHTADNYNQNIYILYSGGGLSVTKWLFLDMNCENDIATISLNNVYDKNTGTSSYNGELPQITFTLSGVNVDIENNATSNKNGIAQAEYDLTGRSGSVTASYYSVSITKPVVFEDTFSSLQKLINKASEGSQLVLHYNYTYNSTWDSALVDGIVIDKDLTIDGQGYTIDAMDASRIFKIDDNTKNIVLKNIKFTNASGDNGAAVYANCNNIEVINCTFEDNQATTNGDAVYVIANGCDITESTFLNNLGTASALYLSSSSENAPFNIDNSILVNNAGANIVKDDKIALTANNNWWGNTVDNTGDLSSGLAQKWYLLDMIIDDIQSIANICLNNLWDGTAYSSCETYALPTITLNIQVTNGVVRKGNVTLDKNGDTVSYIVTDSSGTGTLTASYNGVSIEREIHYDADNDYSFKALKKLIDESQDNDVIVLPHDYEYVIGYDDITSGIDIIQKNLTINGNGHTIDAKGQTRIFNVGSSDNTLQGSNLTIKNATFVNGKMSADGGAISWYGGDGNLANCTFINNTVKSSSSGGAIYIKSNNMKVFNVTFIENKATAKGGSIYIYSNNVTINQSTFVKNDGGSNGGAIYWAECDNGTLIDSTFIGNHATGQGGALETDSKAGDMTVINSTFSNNRVTSTGYGGAIHLGNRKNRNIINSTFRDNYASSKGGALYWDTMNSGYTGIMYNSTFINNTALNGGAINIYSGRLNIDESDFINNTAVGTTTSTYGGAIYSMGDSLNIKNTDFIGNAANVESSTSRGGALYVKSEFGNLNINNSTFIKNSAYSKSSTSGGGVMYTNSKCNITNSTFIANSATVGGSSSTYGGVFYWYGAKGNISKSIFVDNSDKYGAVIYGSQSASKMNVTNSIFINNKKSTNNEVNVMNTVSSGFYNFTECWFGNTRLDGYTPIGLSTNSYIKSNRPLCLELDPHDELMIVDDDKEIKYLLNYVEEGSQYDYDSSKLPKINLTLSTVKADVDKNHALINETVLFNANQYGTVSITAKFYDWEYTEELTAKLKVIITVDENPIVVHVGEHRDVTGISLDPVTLNYITSVVEGDEYIELDNNYYLVGLKEGESFITITTSGDATHAPTTLKVPVTVIKYNTELVALIDSNPVDSIAVDWGGEPQSIQIGILSDDPNPDYTGLSFDFESNDTKVAKFSRNPNLITFGAAGTANITFFTAGNERYYGSEKNITVTVRKVPSSIELSKSDLEFAYGGSDSTALTLVGGSVDYVNISVEGHPEAVIVFENNVITVSGLDVGTYALKVTLTPDENHTSVTETAYITVTKVDSSVEFENNVEFDYLGTGTTKLINFVGCSVDLVNITVEGQTGATVSYDDATKVITVSGLDAGTYTLKVSTTPDGNHNSVDVTADITVNKIDSSVTFGDIEFDYLGSGNTTITDYDGCSVELENITVVDNPQAVIGFENDVVTVSGLGAGIYTLKVTTTPDSNHKSVVKTKGITVNKIPSQITLNNTDIVYKYDESNTTNLTLVGCSVDLVNITVDGNNVAGVTYDEQTKVITVSGIDVGTHTLKVTTTPDENHTSVDKTAAITVEKSNSSVSFSNPVELFFSESGTSTLTLNGCTVDLVNITVLDHPEAVISYENNVITVSNLNIGTYTLKVITTPDSNHLSVVNTTSVTVYKESPKLEIEYSNITVGERELVYVSMNITGQVNITISKDGSVIRTENVTIGSSKFNKTAFTGLNVGTYTITAHYEGQGRYNSSTLTYELVIRPIYEYEFSASVNDTVMGNKTNVTVNLPEGASGNIVIGEIEQKVEGTKTVIELPEQKILGKNNVTVKYVPDEDSKYASRELTVLYEISKVDTSIALSVVNKTTADPVIITAAITAEGNVTFVVNGKKYSKEIISNVATLELTDVTGGEYNVTAIYDGSEKYGNSTANETYTVEKINSTISIDVDPTTIRTDEGATVTVNVQGSGIVTITVNGIKTNVTVDSGVATLPIEKLAKGTTTITAKYLGDDKYNTNETEEITLTVNPIALVGFDIDIVDITVGDDAIAYVIVPSDAANMTNVTVKQGDVVLFSENTTFKLIIPDLAVGTYSITAHYYGDDKYDVAEISKEFTVNPLNMGKLNFTAAVNSTIVGEKTNVTVKISEDATGKIVIGDIERDISESEFVIELPAQTTTGLNNITVQYIPDENSKYGLENITAFYNVAKRSVEITIEDITGKKAGDDVEIVTSAYEGALITVYVDGVKTETVENVSAGKHTIIATVEETDEYLAATANKTFEVTKSDVGTVALLTDSYVYVGEKLTINVNIINVYNDVTGIVEINVNGTKYSLNIPESKLEVVMNKAGNIVLSGRYLGDYKYDAKDASVDDKDVSITQRIIEVREKATPEITIEVDQLSVVGQAMTINVSDLENLTVTINGIEQSVNNGKISFTPAKDGAYTIIAKTTENKTHYAGESIASFTVINKTKQTPEISVSEIGDAKVGSEITFTVDASVGEGVIVKIDDEIIPLKDGAYTYTPKTSGSHIVYVETKENGQYSKGIKTQTFNVDKNDATIKVSADPVKVGETATIEVEVTPGATGLVIINVNGTEYSIKLPQTTLDVVLDDVGSYSIFASYLGDNNFTENASDVISLEVSQKAVSNFTVEIPDDIKVAEPFTINVTSESGADLEVYLDGVKQTLADGKVNVDTLSAGTHTIQVISPETSTHMANSTTQTFTVSKKQAQIKIDVGSDLIVDKNIKLILESYPGAELVVYIDGKALDNWETPFKTTAGNHLIIATVADNDEYLGVTVNKTFTVAKKGSSVHVSGDHATVGEKSIIEVDLTKDATGIVIVNVNGTEYSLNISENNSLSIVLDKAGLYNIFAKYLGDDKYLPSESEVNTIFAEDKKASVIDIDYPVVIYAGDDVNVTISSTGDALEVYLDGEKQTLKDGILAIENISSGTHVLEVVSLETAGFKYNSTSAVLNVAKKQAEITITDISGVKAGDNVSIVVTTDSDSSVVIYVDGERLESTVIENIAAGSHTVIASVEESDLYLKATANKTFTVDKLPATIEVNATNVTQGQATEITVSTNLDEGVVVVKLNGTEVAIDLAKGKSTSVVLDAPGIYEVRANYLGSDKYDSAAAASFIIEVFEKATPEVNVTIPEIKAGEDGNVNISIPNATGEVHVIIDGVDNIIPLNENGTADFTIPEMGAGNHSVVIVYPGDDTHEAKVVTQTVNVEKQTSEANITSPSDVKEGENATVKVEIANATGEVVIIVDGVEEKVQLVNGTVDYPLDNLSAGNHSVVVIYPGDDTHSSAYSASSFNVEAEPVVVKLATEFINITIASDLNITACLADENGNPIADAEIVYRIGDETKSVFTAADGSFTIKGVAKSKVMIEFAGNETLIGTNTSITLENVVSEPKLGSYFNIAEGTSLTTYAVETAVGEKGSLYAFKLRDSNGNPIVNATVTFAYKSVVFNSTTDENGTLYLGISTYLSQVALCAMSYVGDDKHNATFVAFNFNIIKKETVIKASSKNFKVSTKTKKYTVTLKTYKCSSRDGKVYLKAGKQLKLKVNGKNFYAKTNSKGQATFKITNLVKKGKYIAKVSYAGSDTYEGYAKKVTLVVK